MTLKSRFEILVYHRIGRENSWDGLTISERLFEEQMQFVRRRCRPMTLEALVRDVFEGRVIPPRALAVTFDDGYADTYDLAFPILQRIKIPATLFITTAYMDRVDSPPSGAPMLSWKRVLEMQKKGVDIGSHTLTHPNLAQCSLEEVRRQLIGSRERIERKLGKPARLFAYPYGRAQTFNPAVQTCVSQAGFLAACTMLPGSNGPDTDRYALRRLPPLPDTLHRLLTQLDQGAQKKLLKNESKIYGVGKKAMQIWAIRHPKVGRLISRKSPLYWKMGGLQ